MPFLLKKIIFLQNIFFNDTFIHFLCLPRLSL